LKKKENAEREERAKKVSDIFTSLHISLIIRVAVVLLTAMFPVSLVPASLKSLSINEFLKPAEGERYYNPSGRGRGRGRGRGEPGGFRGGYNGGYRGSAAAPAIEDQAQFPALA
jgi:uncharacterized membrane protein YgcG